YFKKSGKKRIARMVDSPHHPEEEVIFALGEAGVIDPEDAEKKTKKTTKKANEPKVETIVETPEVEKITETPEVETITETSEVEKVESTVDTESDNSEPLEE
ncbi:MAG: DNA repair and recombination protein RadA, partial [Nitrosopumilus sp.]|nr:DNA repair and recombination protein RadA [Nitrosopumilus sp.]